MFNLANLISLFRVILIVPCLLYYNAGQDYMGLSIVGLMILTDYADGIVARRLNNVTDFGKAFDPISDKIVIIVFIFYLVLNKNFPIWFILTLITRDVVLMYLGILVKHRSGKMPQANMPGKILANAIAVLIIGFFMDWLLIAQIGLWTSIFFLVYSTIVYLADYKKILMKS